MIAVDIKSCPIAAGAWAMLKRITDELDTIAAMFSALQPLLDGGELLTMLMDGPVGCGKSPLAVPKLTQLGIRQWLS
jgi:hypothetical protein